MIKTAVNILFFFFLFHSFVFGGGSRVGLHAGFFHCCTQAFSSCGEWGLLFVTVHRLFAVVASLVVEHGL